MTRPLARDRLARSRSYAHTHMCARPAAAHVPPRPRHPQLRLRGGLRFSDPRALLGLKYPRPLSESRPGSHFPSLAHFSSPGRPICRVSIHNLYRQPLEVFDDLTGKWKVNGEPHFLVLFLTFCGLFSESSPARHRTRIHGQARASGSLQVDCASLRPAARRPGGPSGAKPFFRAAGAMSAGEATA